MLKQPLKEGTGELEVYTIRWLMLVLFVFAGTANALVLLSFSPISNLANDYWNGIGTTAVNLLAVSFQIMYIPGTLLALYISKKYDLRGIMLAGGLLTTIGCVIRYIGVVKGVHGDASYSVVLLGTAITALAQPFYLNLPAKIAATWFPVSERLANPLGSAIGSVIPPIFVKQEDNGNITGIPNLLLTHLVVAGVALILTFLMFQSQPEKPPSYSAMHMGTTQEAGNRRSMWIELGELFKNKHYVFLLFSFTIVLANLNAVAALINQLPGGYSNGEVGLTGAVLILSGFLGAFLTGFVLNLTKKYRTTLKVAYVTSFGAWILFLSSCRPRNFVFFVLSAGLLGFSLLPTIPSTIVNSVESSFPAPEDLAVGLLYIGANTLAIAFTFIGQVLLTQDDHGYPAPFFPYGFWVMATMFSAVIPIALFQGQYLRLEKDQERLMESDTTTLLA